MTTGALLGADVLRLASEAGLHVRFESPHRARLGRAGTDDLVALVALVALVDGVYVVESFERGASDGNRLQTTDRHVLQVV